MGARLDPFVDRLFREKADQLRLSPDEPVVLIKSGKAKRLSKNPITGEQISALLIEVAPPGVAANLEEGTEAKFRYPSSLGGVQVQVVGTTGGMSAVISPTNDLARGPSPGGVEAERLAALLHDLVESQGSDLHLRVGDPAYFRTDGEMARRDGEPFGAGELEGMLLSILPDRNRVEWEQTGDSDFGYEIPDIARFRVNVARDRKGPVAVFRVIPATVVTVEDLGISQEVQRLCRLTKGLVLITGPTGSGKSTTLCALIDLVNRTRTDHVITIEDPIEFVHENKKCLITQREIGTHTSSFKNALRAALREDPDVVLVGELRDLETAAIAIETAETGHLVFATLHTTTAGSTVDRIIDQFPADRQSQIRAMLSESLKAVIAQTLCKKVGGGRVAAWEILLTTPAVSNLIREAKTFQIPSIIQTSKRLGMRTLNDALLDLLDRRMITADEAYIRAVEKTGMATALKGKGLKFSAAVET